MGEFFDFIKQLPFSFIFFFVSIGALYIGLMWYFMQRRKKRRQTKQEALAAFAQQDAAQSTPPGASFFSKLLNISSPAPAQPAEDWTIPPELRRLPEPDLDILAGPVMPERRREKPVRVVGESGSTEAASAALIAELARDNSQLVTDYAQTTPEVSSDMANMPGGSVELPADAIEVLRVFRDLSDGKLIVQLGDQRYRALSDIQNADLARRFTAIVRELAAMINAAGRAAPGTMAAPQPKMGLLTTEQEPLAKPGMLRNIAKAATGKSDVMAGSPTGIANAVEEFLQFKLSNTPELARRSIHIRPAPDQGIRIEVDGRSYSGIGDVADVEVREFLYNMMREWEARH